MPNIIGLPLNPRAELEIQDGDFTYIFTIAPGPQGGKLYSIVEKEWEPADGTLPWRVPLHPWAAGLGPNRVNPKITFSGELKNRPSMVYAKANADASNPNYLTAPPALNSLGTVVSSTYFNSPNQLYYGGAYYGGVEYMGAGASSSQITKVVRNWNGKAYFGAGQYLLALDASYNLTTVKDFTAGKSIADIEPFKNELIIAMGATEKIWKMTTAQAFTQATDATYAIALGTVDDKLWRADENGNLLSNCITTPLTLTNWVPTGTNAYPVGDSTYPIVKIQDYGGVPWVRKADGVYAPDGNTVFHNQTPQLKDYPDVNNIFTSMFTAWGYLWVPSLVGLLRVTIGESLPIGPELSHRPDFRFWVKDGVEWNGSVLLTCVDAANSENTFVCKMMKDTNGIAETPYIYHELVQLGQVASNFITIFAVPTNPTCLVGRSSGLYYFLEGRGSGLDVDDSNYTFGTSYYLDSGEFVATDDRAIEISLVGVKILGKQPAGATLTAQYQLDRSGVFSQMKNNEEYGGSTNIGDTGFFTRTLYAPPETLGHSPRIKLVGTLPAGIKGTNRPEIYEAWAFGDAHPATTDIISLGIVDEPTVRTRGLRHGYNDAKGNPLSAFNLLRLWSLQQRTLIFKLPGYDIANTAWGTVIELDDSSSDVVKDGNQQVFASIAKLTIRRVDFTGVLYG